MSNPKKPRRRRPNATGRNESEQYANLGYPMMQSAAWRSLGGSAIKVLMELRTRFNGSNNGRLALSLDHAADLLGIGKATVARAFKELQAKGFVVETERGQWYGRKPTTWALTFLPVDGRPATHEWKRWIPQKQSVGSNMDRERA